MKEHLDRLMESTKLAFDGLATAHATAGPTVLKELPPEYRAALAGAAEIAQTLDGKKKKTR